MIHSFWRFATFYAPAHRAEVELCRISGGRLGAEVPFEIGESRRCQPGECGDAICGEEVPVPRLPRRAQSLVTRESELQQWHQRRRKNKESNDFAVTRNQGMALQEEFTDGKWPRHNFTEKHGTPTAIENGVYSVVRRAIRAKAKRWRRIDRINRGARTERTTGDNRGCQRGRNGNVQTHPWA
jgi:hypothetical protein